MTQIVSIHSFRRGTGKTSLAANLAALLAYKNLRVGLMDADFQLPSAHLWFGLEQEKLENTINRYLAGACKITEAAYRVTDRLGSVMQGELFVIPASTRYTDIQKHLRVGLPTEKFQMGLEDLLSELNLDVLLVDVAAGLNEDTLFTIACSDMLLVTLRPDKQDFQGTAVVLEVGRKLNVPQMYLVMNQSPTGYNAAEVRQQLISTYQCDVACILPHSEAMLQTGGQGILAVQAPANPYVLALKPLVELLAQAD